MNQANLERIRGLSSGNAKRIKRRAGYGLEEEEETRLRMKRLHIDEPPNAVAGKPSTAE